MSERKLRVEEVALLAGVSIQTVNTWYRWKAINPSHPLAAKLPDYEQSGPRRQRLWNKADVWSIIEFKTLIPHGRGGILGDITQKSTRKRKLTNGEN